MASQIPGQGGTNLGVAPNVGGLLCYVPCCAVGLIFSIVAAIIEKQSRFLRFHAFQSLLLHGVGIVLWLGLTFLSFALEFGLGGMGAGMIIWVLQMAIGLALLVAIIYMMVKAYGGEETELPVIGAMARKWA